jgi:hypothetical protein
MGLHCLLVGSGFRKTNRYSDKGGVRLLAIRNVRYSIVLSHLWQCAASGIIGKGLKAATQQETLRMRVIILYYSLSNYLLSPESSVIYPTPIIGGSVVGVLKIPTRSENQALS